MPTAAIDPSTSELLAALVAGGFLALAATITGIFGWLNTRQARKAVVDHVNDEEGTIAAFQATLDRMDSKFDEVLAWQGRHEALHERAAAHRSLPHPDS
jgi:hypothetical protein